MHQIHFAQGSASVIAQHQINEVSALLIYLLTPETFSVEVEINDPDGEEVSYTLAEVVDASTALKLFANVRWAHLCNTTLTPQQLAEQFTLR